MYTYILWFESKVAEIVLNVIEMLVNIKNLELTIEQTSAFVPCYMFSRVFLFLGGKSYVET